MKIVLEVVDIKKAIKFLKGLSPAVRARAYNQNHWCGTAKCVAGWAAYLKYPVLSCVQDDGTPEINDLASDMESAVEKLPKALRSLLEEGDSDLNDIEAACDAKKGGK